MMLWEDNEQKAEYEVPDNVVDLYYKIDCKQIPTMHAWELSQALLEVFPWLIEEPEMAIQQIHGATTGNGWERPSDDEIMHLSKRTRMHLRVPKHRVDDALLLTGKALDIAGYTVNVGEALVKKLSPISTLFARYVVVPEVLDENDFIEWVVNEFKRRDIKLRKVLCGISHTICTPDRSIETRSLMVADLDKVTSVALQEQGVGSERHLGCGVFLPHKGVKAVGETEDKEHFSGT
jgi:CRISPR-associated protein Cas6